MPSIRGDADAFLRGLGLALHSNQELTARQAAIFDLVQAALDLVDAVGMPTSVGLATFNRAAAEYSQEAVAIWKQRAGLPSGRASTIVEK